MEAFQLSPSDPPLSHQEVVQTQACKLLIMRIVTIGVDVDILIMKIRSSEIIVGMGKTIPVVSRTPHDKGARGSSRATNIRHCTRHSRGRWW